MGSDMTRDKTKAPDDDAFFNLGFDAIATPYVDGESNLIDHFIVREKPMSTELEAGPGRGRENNNFRHGFAASGVASVYNIWTQMIQRCHNKNNASFSRYGGRGVFVCDEWRGDGGFTRFLADLGDRPSQSHSIDRIDNDGPYCKENCRWATIKEQSRNKRTSRMLTANGETRCLQEWAERLQVHPAAILDRLRRGWTEHDAVTRPSRFATSPSAERPQTQGCRVKLTRRKSGLIVPVEPPPPPKPLPDDLVRKDILAALSGLEDELGWYEQTTHATLQPGTLEGVARCLVTCYENPTAFTISDLAQVIRKFVEQQKGSQPPSESAPGNDVFTPENRGS